MSDDERKVLEGEAAEEQYEATVLDFLDQEIAADGPPIQQATAYDDVDVMLSSVLKQAIGLTSRTETAEDTEPLVSEQSLVSLDRALKETQDVPAPPQEAPPPPPLLPEPAADRQDPEPVAAAAAEEKQVEAASPFSTYSSGPARDRRGLALGVKAAAGLAAVLAGAYLYWMTGAPDGSAVKTDPPPAAVSEGRAEPGATVVTEAAVPAGPAAGRPVSGTASGGSNNPATSTRAAAPGASAPAVPPSAPGSGAPAAERGTASPAGMAAESSAGGRNAPAAAREDSPAVSLVPVIPASTAPPAEQAPATAGAIANAPPPLPLPSPPQPAPLIPAGGASTAMPETSAPVQPAPAQRDAVPAELTLRALPVYPEIARRARITGTVMVDVEIDDRGRVTKATSVSGPSALQTAAVDAILKWRYKPASLNGVNVSSRTRVAIVFKNQ